MKKDVLFILLLLVIIAVAMQGQAAANLITNGSFDVSVPSNGTGGGWTSSNIDGSGGWRISGGLPDEMFILNDAGAVSTDPTIQQLVTGLTPGATYRLTGNYANFWLSYGSLGANTFAVDVDGITLDKLDYPGPAGWGLFLFDIVAPDSDLSIAFRAEIDGDDTDYMIDNISLVYISNGDDVPEPSTILLLASGLAGLAALRRKFKI